VQLKKEAVVLLSYNNIWGPFAIASSRQLFRNTQPPCSCSLRSARS